MARASCCSFTRYDRQISGAENQVIIRGHYETVNALRQKSIKSTTKSVQNFVITVETNKTSTKNCKQKQLAMDKTFMCDVLLA